MDGSCVGEHGAGLVVGCAPAVRSCVSDVGLSSRLRHVMSCVCAWRPSAVCCALSGPEVVLGVIEKPKGFVRIAGLALASPAQALTVALYVGPPGRPLRTTTLHSASGWRQHAALPHIIVCACAHITRCDAPSWLVLPRWCLATQTQGVRGAGVWSTGHPRRHAAATVRTPHTR